MFQIFLFWRNPKNDQVRAKKPNLGPKNQNSSVRNSFQSKSVIFWGTDLKLRLVIRCYILNTFWYNNVFSQSAPSGPIEPPKFNQGLKSFNKDISRTVGQILKIRPLSTLQIQFSITFILCKSTIFLLLRAINYKKLFLDDPRADTDPTF